MSEQCRIIRDQDGDLVGVHAPNGEKSELYDKIESLVGKDQDRALSLYKQAQALTTPKDKNGEPTVESVEQITAKPKKPVNQPLIASPATMKKIGEFNDRIGVKKESLAELVINGKKVGANGVAIPYEGLIKIVNGKEAEAVPEESMHFAVEIIQQKSPSLFKSLMADVGNYKLTDQVFSDYSKDPIYQTPDGKPDVVKLKKEAIGKVLAAYVIGDEKNESPERIATTMTLWQKVKDFLKNLFSKAGFNPFEEVSKQVLGEKEFKGDVSDLSNKEKTDVYLQKNDDIWDKIDKQSELIGKNGDKYTVNGQDIDHSVEDKVNAHYDKVFRSPNSFYKARENFREDIEQKAHIDIQNIIGKYLDDNGNKKAVEEYDKENKVSAVDPFTNTFYNTLDAHMKERIESYSPGTRFLINKDLYDPKTRTAGRADFIALMPDGKVDVLQFKTIAVSEKTVDIDSRIQEGYGIEVTGLRNILKSAYGIKDEQFRQTRAIPIKAEYEYSSGEGFELNTLKVGSTNVQLIKDDILLPVPSASERIENRRLSELIDKFKGQLEKIAKLPAKEGEQAVKKERVAQLLAGVRNLQVKGEASKLLKSSGLLVKFHEDHFKTLSNRVDAFIPEAVDLITHPEEINDISNAIEDAKNQLTPFLELDYTMEKALKEDEGAIKKASEISDGARRLVRRLNDLATDFMVDKASKVPGFTIDDEMQPEKQLTWYRKFVRSLGQSAIKSGWKIWKLVERNSNLFQDRMRTKIGELNTLMKEVADWKGTKPWKDVYNKIFEYENGRWTGSVVKKISKDFYKKINKAVDAKNMAFVKANIDLEKYNARFDKGLEDLKETNNTAHYDDDPKIDAAIKKQKIADYNTTYNIRNKSSLNKHNWMLHAFPIEEKWHSDAYKEISQKGNEPLLKMWNYYDDAMQRSYESGMFTEHWQRHGFFPNLDKDWMSKLKDGSKGGAIDLFGAIQIHPNDEQYGEIDPESGKPINKIHAWFMNDLGRSVKDTDGNYYKDYSEKSQDFFRAMAMWEREIQLFNLRTETEGIAKLIVDTESRRKTLKTTNTGLLARVKGKEEEVQLVENTTNLKYIQDFLDVYWYGKKLSNEMDVVFSLPWGKAARSINKFMGTKLLEEPIEDNIQLSGMKALDAANRFFRLKILGLNPLTPVAHMFGGISNLLIKGGDYFSKTDALKAMTRLTASGFKTEEGKKYSALLDYFNPMLDDLSFGKARKLSTTNMTKYLSSDKLYFLQTASNDVVNYTTAIAFFDNTIIKDGKLLNVKEYVHSINDWEHIYSNYEGKALEARKRDIENQIEDLKKNSPDMLVRATKLNEKGEAEIPAKFEDNIAYRQRILEYIKAILGNPSGDDIALYKRNVMAQSFFLFKNWIPRMLDERGQSLKYAPGTDRMEWGRMRMLFNAVIGNGMNGIKALTKQLTGNHGDLIELAKREYEKKKTYMEDQHETFKINEADFVDMYVKGVSSGFKELALSMSLLGILIALKVSQPATSDPQEKGYWRYMQRAVTKLQDRLSFFYNPASFIDLASGSVFPALGMLSDAEKVINNSVKYGYYSMTGDEAAAKKVHVRKYVYEAFPISKQFSMYEALFNTDFAKSTGIQISSSTTH